MGRASQEMLRVAVAPRVPGGPELSLELGLCCGLRFICSPRLFTRDPQARIPALRHRLRGCQPRSPPCPGVSLLGLRRTGSITVPRERASSAGPGLGAQRCSLGLSSVQDAGRPTSPEGGDPGPEPRLPVPAPATRPPSRACGAVTPSQCYLLQSIFSDPWVSVSVRRGHRWAWNDSR